MGSSVGGGFSFRGGRTGIDFRAVLAGAAVLTVAGAEQLALEGEGRTGRLFVPRGTVFSLVIFGRSSSKSPGKAYGSGLDERCFLGWRATGCCVCFLFIGSLGSCVIFAVSASFPAPTTKPKLDSFACAPESFFRAVSCLFWVSLACVEDVVRAGAFRSWVLDFVFSDGWLATVSLDESPVDSAALKSPFRALVLL